MPSAPEEDSNAPSLRFHPPEKLLGDEAPADGVILPPGWKSVILPPGWKIKCGNNFFYQYSSYINIYIYIYVYIYLFSQYSA